MFMLLVEIGGIFQFVVIDIVNGCQVFDSVMFIEDFEVFVAIFVMLDIFNCVDSFVILNGSGFSINGNFRYEWMAFNSGVMFVFDNFIVEVMVVGFYVLEVGNLDNGCMVIDIVEVFQDINLFVVVIELADILICVQLQVILNVVLSNFNNNFSL